MGEVYKAYDDRLRRHVAIKHISSDNAEDAVRRARFRREARTAAQISHPAIVNVFDILEREDGEWIVMEYVEGSDLRALSRDRALPVADVLYYAIDVADALSAAHARGVVHRDLKTENVMVSPDGHAKVLDFGIAKRLASHLEQDDDGSASLSVTGEVLGTVRAMSPEQARGLDVDLRSDLFSLGILLYELLSGISPFRGASVLDTLMRVNTHEQTPLVKLEGLEEPIPVELSDLVQELLQKLPELRPRSADSVRERLEQIRNRLNLTTRPRLAVKAAKVSEPDEDEETDLGSAIGSGRAEADDRAPARPEHRDNPAEPPRTVNVRAKSQARANPDGLAPRGSDTGSDANARPAIDDSSGPMAASLVTGAHGQSPRPAAASRADTAAEARAGRPRWRMRALLVTGIGLALAGGVAVVVGSRFGGSPGRTSQLASQVQSRDAGAADAAGRGEPVPTDPRAAYEFAMGLVRDFYLDGNLDRAIEIFQRMSVANEKSAPAHAGLARAYYYKYASTGEPMYLNQAAQVAERAVSLDSLLADGYVSRGLVAMEQGKPDQATSDFRAAIEISPNLADAYHGQGLLALRQRDSVGAEAALARAIELAPSDPRLHDDLGTALFTQGLYARSAAAFERALAMEGTADQYGYQGRLADAYRQMPGYEDKARSHHTRALQLLDAALERSPDDATLLGQRALMAAKLGECASAEVALESLARLTESQLATRYRTAVAWEICGERARAVAGLEAALDAGLQKNEIDQDPELRALRSDPAYHQMFARRATE